MIHVADADVNDSTTIRRRARLACMVIVGERRARSKLRREPVALLVRTAFVSVSHSLNRFVASLGPGAFMKQKITLTTLTTIQQFQIPSPYRAWCHSCNQGFRTLVDLTRHNRQKQNMHQRESVPTPQIAVTTPALSIGMTHDDDTPMCSNCGMAMVRAGSCYSCKDCGETSGCA